MNSDLLCLTSIKLKIGIGNITTAISTNNGGEKNISTKNAAKNPNPTTTA